MEMDEILDPTIFLHWIPSLVGNILEKTCYNNYAPWEIFHAPVCLVDYFFKKNISKYHPGAKFGSSSGPTKHPA